MLLKELPVEIGTYVLRPRGKQVARQCASWKSSALQKDGDELLWRVLNNNF